MDLLPSIGLSGLSKVTSLKTKSATIVSSSIEDAQPLLRALALCRLSRRPQLQKKSPAMAHPLRGAPKAVLQKSPAMAHPQKLRMNAPKLISLMTRKRTKQLGKMFSQTGKRGRTKLSRSTVVHA